MLVSCYKERSSQTQTLTLQAVDISLEKSAARIKKCDTMPENKTVHKAGVQPTVVYKKVINICSTISSGVERETQKT
jgi:hypothetical protein